MSRKILFITPQTIKERTGLHANVDEKLVNPEIMTAQDMFIHPALGTGLYNRLLDGIEKNNLTDIEQDLIDTYITPTLVYYVLGELPMGLSFQFYNKGLIRKTGTEQIDPSAADLVDVADRYKARAEWYKNRLIKYVKETASKGVHFREYINPGTGLDIIHPEQNAYTTSIWIGDDCCPKCGKRRRFEDMYQGDTFRCCGY
jgi:hypothetical protein